MRKVAIPKGTEWVSLEWTSGRFYPVKMLGSTVLLDEHGSVWAELFDSDSTNLVFRTLQPMSPVDLRTAFSYLVAEGLES